MKKRSAVAGITAFLMLITSVPNNSFADNIQLNRLRYGMTPKEVEDILGKNSGRGNLSFSVDSKHYLLYWVDNPNPTERFAVLFEDNKFFSLNSNHDPFSRTHSGKILYDLIILDPYTIRYSTTYFQELITNAEQRRIDVKTYTLIDLKKHNFTPQNTSNKSTSPNQTNSNQTDWKSIRDEIALLPAEVLLVPVAIPVIFLTGGGGLGLGGDDYAPWSLPGLIGLLHSQIPEKNTQKKRHGKGAISSPKLDDSIDVRALSTLMNMQGPWDNLVVPSFYVKKSEVAFGVENSKVIWIYQCDKSRPFRLCE